MNYRHLLTGVSVLGLLLCTAGRVSAQATTNNIDAPNNATSTANPNVNLDQAGSLVNTQVNTFPLGRSVVGNGVADCSSSGIALSAFGNGIGPFDTGSIGGSFTYTQSFGMKTCKAYAKTQLARASLETCLLLISNYSKMTKAGIGISYEDLKQLAGIDCPTVSVPNAGGSPLSAAPQQEGQGNNSLNARRRQLQQTSQEQFQPVSSQQRHPEQQSRPSPQPTANQSTTPQNFVQQQPSQPLRQQPTQQPQPSQPTQQVQRPVRASSNQESGVQALQ